MLKRADIEKKCEDLVMPIIEENNFELVDVEYLKEGSDYYLRVYADKEGGINIDDCVLISRALNEKLDENDFIKEAYILEVSSPGLGRHLKKDKDFKRSIGENVEIRLYKSMEGAKEFEGELVGYSEETITIVTEDEKEINFRRADIALIRLAFDF
jgi:ribosome maturation factor RimP